MTEQELLTIAAENLTETCNRLCVIAADPNYLNLRTPEIYDLQESFKNQFTLCFTLKNAFDSLRKSKK